MPIRTHHIQKIDLLPQDTALLRFDRQDFHFQSGQHVTVQLPKSDDRDYSLASGEADPFLEILVKRVDDGALSPRLCDLKVGDEIQILGLGGVMVLDPAFSDKPHLFLATGTGLAPFRSFARSHPELNYRVVHGTRHFDVGSLYDAFDPNRLVACVSREWPPSVKTSSKAFQGRVTDWLRSHFPTPETRVYLCGNSRMIEDASDILLDGGFPPENIHTEVYF